MDKNSLIVMSYNIDQNGTGGDGSREKGTPRRRLDNILNLFGTAIPFPDILLLQEVLNDEEDFTSIKNCLQKGQPGSNWHHYFAAEGTRDEGNAVLSRYPLHNPGTLVFNKQSGYGEKNPRNAVHTDIVAGEAKKTIRVYSTHLESGENLLGAIKAVTDTQKAQFQQLKDDADKSGTSMQIIGGDFNNPFQIPEYRELLKLFAWDIQPFIDTFRDFKGDRTTCFYKNSIIKFAETLKIVTIDFDYILSTTSNVCNPEIGGEDSKGWSDHLPIWVTIGLNG